MSTQRAQIFFQQQAHAINMEQALIGSVLAYPASASEVTDVRPQDMSVVSHQVIWREILGQERANALSFRGVVEVLSASKNLEAIGQDVAEGDITGELYLQELLARRAQESVRMFGDRVIEASIKREIYQQGQLLMLDAESDTAADDILDKAEQKLFEMRRRKIDDGVHISDLLSAFADTVDGYRSGEIQPAFVFHNPDIKRLVHFLEEQDFFLVAGRPGEGKSSLLRAEAFQAALRGVPVTIFNLENGELEYARYLVAMMTGLDSARLRDPRKLTNEEVNLAKEAITQLRSLPLRIVTMGSPSVFDIVRVARKSIEEGHKAIFVDYIQLIRNGISNVVEDISVSSGMLRGLSLKYRVPVIAASQLNREVVHRGVDAEPTLADLRGSGSLEQDAVGVIFTRVLPASEEQLMAFPENRDQQGNLIDNPRAVYVRFYVSKQRNGPIGKTRPVKWDRATNRFYSLTVEQ